MKTWLYIAVMALVTYLIRALPLTVFHKKIQNRWVRSFLYYVPYACLSAMTFPGILTSTGNMISGGAALIVAVILAYFGRSLITVALSSSCVVLITEWVLSLAGIG